MPDLPEASSSASARRCLVIAETTESAYRYAASDAQETDIVLATADGVFEGAEGAYESVVVAGFASDPAVLAKVVDAAFGHGQVVAVGASGQAVAGPSDTWSSAFGAFRVAGVSTGPFPAVELVREPGAETGDFVRGALAVLAHWVPRPDLRPVLPPVSESPKSAPTKSASPPSSLAVRVRRAAKKFVKTHRRLVVIAAIVAMVAVAATVGLVALINDYALGLLSLAVLVLLGLSVALQELRGRRLQAAVARIDARSATLRDLAPPFQPATVAERLNNHATGLNSLQRSLAVVELAAVDSAKTLERVEAALDADRGGRA